MKKLLSLASLLFLAIGFTSIASVPAHAATDKQAAAYISEIGDDAITIIKDKSLSKPEKAKQLETIFNNSVDFPWVSRFVMGRFWREASDAQRTRYTDLYQKFLVLHYAQLFSEYTGGSFKILSTRNDGDNEYTVSMQIQSGADQGEPVLIDYKVRATGKNFQIFDVTIEGVSMLSTQRSEFASILNNKGIDYLIEQLEKKSESLSAAK